MQHHEMLIHKCTKSGNVMPPCVEHTWRWALPFGAATILGLAIEMPLGSCLLHGDANAGMEHCKACSRTTHRPQQRQRGCRSGR